MGYRKRENVQLAYPFSEKRALKWGFPIVCQPKLNGFRCRAELINNEWILQSSTGDIILSVPQVKRELEKHKTFLSKKGLTHLDGELYLHGKSFEYIESACSRTKNITENKIEFHIFDVAEFEPATIQAERLVKLLELDSLTLTYLKRVPNELTHDLDDIYRAIDHYHNTLNYEGIILRHPYAFYSPKRSTMMMKFKPRAHDAYLIDQVLEAYSKDGVPLGMAGAFMLSREGQRFKVGAGQLTHNQRRDIWDERESIIGQKSLLISYQNITNRGVPYAGVAVKLISKEAASEFDPQE